MAKPKPVEDTRTQRQKFIDLASETGATEDPGVFRKLVESVGRAPVSKPKKAAKKRKGT
jgi:hypothetical protein